MARLFISAKINSMTTNPHATTILCYGDSNTWGQKPDKTGRYPVDIRWTGRLQKRLGDDYYIIEEGLGSRTTDLEYDKKPGRNGRTYFVPCLASHNPIDLVVLMLGTNDLKIEFHRSPKDIADAIKGLLDDINQYASTKNNKPPKVLVVSPIKINNTARDFKTFYEGVYYDAESATKSNELATAIQAVTNEAVVSFFDASTVAAAGEDGIHFSEEAHIALADALEKKIHEMVPSSSN
jgi:lysophospholipase L1-like esterase